MSLKKTTESGEAQSGPTQSQRLSPTRWGGKAAIIELSEQQN